MPAANHIAFTAPINPAGASPVLNRAQIWAGLQRKIKAGQDFVGGAIVATDVLEEYTDEKSGNPVVVREVVFRDGDRRVKETCVAYEPVKVDFLQTDGSTVSNVVSEDAEGALFMTYVFEWRHPGMSEDELKESYKTERALAQKAVEATIVAMREMVSDGRIKA